MEQKYAIEFSKEEYKKIMTANLNNEKFSIYSYGFPKNVEGIDIIKFEVSNITSKEIYGPFYVMKHGWAEHVINSCDRLPQDQQTDFVVSLIQEAYLVANHTNLKMDGPVRIK